MSKTKQQKREEAEERRRAFLSRTAEQQMSLVRQRPGVSLKERERLIAKLEKEDK